MNTIYNINVKSLANIGLSITKILQHTIKAVRETPIMAPPLRIIIAILNTVSVVRSVPSSFWISQDP